MKKVILTGDRPTGRLHVGHYAGSLKERVKLQNSGEYDDIYLMIADAQALTDNAEHPEKVRQNILQVALDYLACGIDPNKSTIFVQSMIPELTELTFYYMNLVTVSRVQRNPTVKAEIQMRNFEASIPVGFFCYPIFLVIVTPSAPLSFFRISAECNPAEQPYKRDAEENADAVDADVLYRRAAVGDRRLVELIARGKGDTEDAGKKREREAAQAVDVERKRNTDCKQTVLCHMSQLPHRVLILVSQFLDLFIIPSAVHDVVDRDENAARHFFTEL